MKPTTLKRIDEWSCQDIVFCIACDPQMPRIWFGSSDFGVYEFDLAQDKPQRIALKGEGHSSYVTGIVRVGDSVISSSYDQRLIWWDIANRRQLRNVDAHRGWIRRVVATVDGSRVLSVGDDMQCKIWDVAHGHLLATVSDHAAMTPHHYPSMLYAVATSPDGKHFATGDRVGHVAIWDLQTFAKVGEVEAPVMYTWDPKARRHSIGGIRSLAFSPDGHKLAVGGIGKIGNIDHLGGPARLEVFDWATGARELEIEDNKKKGLIEQIVWSPNQEWIMTAGGDHNGFITIYDAVTGELVHQDGQNGHIHGVACADDFSQIYAASHERITRWSMA